MRVIRQAEQSAVSETFKILETTDRSQLAVMVLADGEVSGEFGNEHPDSDQIVVVLQGSGRARVRDETVNLQTGDVLVVPAGAPHQVIGPNRTLNFYAPVAYPEGQAGS